MRRFDTSRSPIRRLLIPLALTLWLSVTISASEGPRVLSMVAVVDEATGSLERYAEIPGHLNKVLPAEDEQVLGDIFWSSQSPTDFGWVQVRSRLTGQVLLRASVIWGGTGRIEQPASETFLHDWVRVAGNPGPGSFLVLPYNGATDTQARSLWERVRDTDFVARVASAPAYEVVAARHDYGGGGMPPETDWIFFIFSRPRAPENVSLLQTLWPRGYTRSGSFLEPEVRVHNFADIPLSVGVRLSVDRPTGDTEVFYRSIGAVPPDRSVALRTTPFPLDGLGSGTLSWKLTGPSGEPWMDADSSDDHLDAGFAVVDEPVFRPVSSIRHPGPVPARGTGVDFDRDGDADLLTHEYRPRIWRNDGDDGFQDITDSSPVSLRPHPRMFVPADFTGDRNPDILVVYFGTAPMLLEGDGGGRFQDVSADVGLDVVVGRGQAAVGDLDGDEDADLVLAGYEREVLLRNDEGRFVDVIQTSGINDLLQTQSVTIGDLDIDGIPDLVLVNWNGPSRVFHNLLNWSFEEILGPFPPGGNYDAEVLDYDRDGHPDILFANPGAPSLLCRGLGQLRFEAVPAEEHGLPGALRATAQDVNDDGWTDLLLEQLNRFYLFMNDEGQFTDRTELLVDMDDHFRLGALGTTPHAQWIDLDGDGDLDLHSQMVTLLDMTQGDFPPYAPWTDYPPFFPDEPGERLPENWIEMQAPAPCPFTVKTRIVFRTGPGQHVHLDVLDVAGRRVARLLDGVAGDEPLEVTWDGRTTRGRPVPAGIYYFHLVGASDSATRSVVLIR